VVSIDSGGLENAALQQLPVAVRLSTAIWSSRVSASPNPVGRSCYTSRAGSGGRPLSLP
jgi:hypothetical protein